MTRTAGGMLAGFLLSVAGASLALLGLFALWGRAGEWGRGARADDRARILFTGWGGVIERGVFTRLVDEFERRHPEIDVEYRPVPRDYVTKLKLMFAGGTPPDVYYLPDGDFPGFAAAGRTLDLQPFIERSSVFRTEEIWDSGLRRYRFDGRVFGQGPLHALPKDIGPTAMFVNLDLLSAAGVSAPSPETPLTWDEAVPLWKRLTRDLDNDGRTDQWGTHGMHLEAAVWSHGGRFLSDDGRRFVMARDPRALEAAEWLVSLQTEHRVAPMERQRQSIPVDTMFLTGRMATFVGGRWMVPMFRNAEFAWDVVPIPVSPVRRRLAGWSGSVGLAIAPSTRQRDAAWKLVEFLSGPEGQEVQARTGFQVPNQKRMSRTEVFLQPGQQPAHPEVFLRAAEHQRGGPPTRTPDGQWFDTMFRALSRAFRGEASATEALREAEGEIQAALDRAWEALPE